MKVMSLSFSAPADQELKRLRSRTRARTKADVIRNALSLYSFIVSEMKQGSDVNITRGNVASSVLVPGTSRIRRRPAGRNTQRS